MRLPDRLLEEDAALAVLRDGEPRFVKSYRWIREPGGEPRVTAVLDLDASSVELEVRFPAHYPEGCPSVRPIPYAALSSHQFGGTGVLCLEVGPDNWHPHYTAADMLRSAWRLLAHEIISTVRSIAIPSRHVSDLAERVRAGVGVLLRTEEFERRLLVATEPSEFEFVWPPKGDFRFFPVAFPKGANLTDLPPALAAETRSTGLFVRLASEAPEVVPSDPDAFANYLTQYGSTSLSAASPLVMLLQWPGRGARGYLRLSKKVVALVDMAIETQFDARTPGQLRATLSKLKIGIVGVGSLGSRVAISLARTGVRKWVLVDGDVLRGTNLCRFPAGFADVGSLKVDAVREAIRQVSVSEPEVTCHPVVMASATNPDVHARTIEELGSADIIIDATASPEVFGLLAMLASDKRRPLVWGEVFGAGIGGLVASAHPDHGPCPRCIRVGFLAVASTWPPAPRSDADEPYAGGDDNPAVATDADVAAIGAALTNRVMDIARGEPPLAAVSVLGLRTGWIFDAPMQAVHVPVRSDDWFCQRCWRMAAEPNEHAAARVEALLSEPDNAHDSSAT